MEVGRSPPWMRWLAGLRSDEVPEMMAGAARSALGGLRRSPEEGLSMNTWIVRSNRPQGAVVTAAVSLAAVNVVVTSELNRAGSANNLLGGNS